MSGRDGHYVLDPNCSEHVPIEGYDALGICVPCTWTLRRRVNRATVSGPRSLKIPDRDDPSVGGSLSLHRSGWPTHITYQATWMGTKRDAIAGGVLRYASLDLISEWQIRPWALGLIVLKGQDARDVEAAWRKRKIT